MVKYLLIGILTFLFSCTLLSIDPAEIPPEIITLCNMQDNTGLMAVLTQPLDPASISNSQDSFFLFQGTNSIPIIDVALSNGTTIVFSLSSPYSIKEPLFLSYSGSHSILSINTTVLSPFFGMPVKINNLNNLIFWNSLNSLNHMTNGVLGPGMIKGSSSSFVEGQWGQALYQPKTCTGSNMDKLPGGILNLRLFTVEYWVKASPLAAGSARSPFSRITAAAEAFNIVHRNGYAGWYNTAYSVTDNSGNQIAYLVEHTNQAGNDAYLPVGTWVHFAMTVDMNLPDGEKIRIYRNGIRQATTILHNIGDMPDKLCMEPIIINGSFRDNEGSESATDNIKIYNYAKTNFILSKE